MRFEFATAARIVFGPGTLSEAGPAAATLGRRALLVTGAHPERAGPLIAMLQQHGLDVDAFPVPGEPTLALVRQGVAAARGGERDIIIGFGGGSALDTAKAIAALATNEGDVLDYVEVIGQGRALQRPALPLIAIPTTAGTGSEVTRNAVLASPEHGVKVSLRSAFLLPRLAIVDPQLTYSLPPDVTASTGLDALTQLLEAFVSRRANPLTDALAREGLHLAARALPRAWKHGDDTTAREEMALAALLSGMALANAGLGAVHGWPQPSAGASPPRTGPSAPGCCRRSGPPTSAPCGSVGRPERHCRATRKLPASSRAILQPRQRMELPGRAIWGGRWTSRRSRPMAWGRPTCPPWSNTPQQRAACAATRST